MSANTLTFLCLDVVNRDKRNGELHHRLLLNSFLGALQLGSHSQVHYRQVHLSTVDFGDASARLALSRGQMCAHVLFDNP